MKVAAAALDAVFDDRERRGVWWLAAAFWAVLIFVGSSIPSAHWAGGVNARDAFLHAAEYAILAALLRRTGLSWTASVALAAAYGASDELHQSFVRNRDASPTDLFFDVVGAAVGAWLLRPRERSTTP